MRRAKIPLSSILGEFSNIRNGFFTLRVMFLTVYHNSQCPRCGVAPLNNPYRYALHKKHVYFWNKHNIYIQTAMPRQISSLYIYIYTQCTYAHMHIHTHIHTGAYLRHWCLVGAMSSHRCQSTMTWHVASSRFYIYKEYVPIWRHWTGILICFI